jgi:membrane protease YdiL (CAAX protease family)
VKQKKETAAKSGPGCWIVVITGAIIATYLLLTNGDPKLFEAYNLINTGLCLWLPLMVLLIFLRVEPSEYGLTVGDAKKGLTWAFLLWLAMLTPLIVVSFRPEFREQYLTYRLAQILQGFGPVYDGLRVNPRALIYYELSMGFYMFCWEFFFRGYLLFGLRQIVRNDLAAVVLQTIPFVLLHWSPEPGASKPLLEILGAVPAGLILGYLALKTRSCVYGFIAHWGVSVTLDLLLLRHVWGA